jgi:hypothetical protein
VRPLEESQLLSVAEDIEYLRDKWSDGVSDADLRRGSALLRRFLIDGGNGILMAVWHLLGLPKQPCVKASSLPPQILAAGAKVELAAAGGAKVAGAIIGGFRQTTEKIAAEFLPDGSEQLLLEYVGAPSVIIHGENVTRRELVKFFAHYLGGVHMSSKVLKKEENMVRRIRKIETVRIDSRILGKDLLHFELLAIGQTIGRSDDFKTMTEVIRKRAGVT